MSSLEWTSGMDEEEKKNFLIILHNNTQLIRRLHAILDQWDKEIEKSEFTIKDYDTPNWAVKQAHRNGDRGRIKKVKDLFTL